MKVPKNVQVSTSSSSDCRFGFAIGIEGGRPHPVVSGASAAKKQHNSLLGKNRIHDLEKHQNWQPKQNEGNWSLPWLTTPERRNQEDKDSCGERSEERRVGKECRSRW